MTLAIVCLAAALVALTTSASVVYPHDESIQGVHDKAQFKFESNSVVSQPNPENPDDIHNIGDDVAYPYDEYIQGISDKGELEFKSDPAASQFSTTESPDDIDDNDGNTDDEIEDFSDEDDADDGQGEIGIDEETTIDGIQLKYLTPDEVLDLLEDDDNLVVAELDIAVAKEAVLDRMKGGSSSFESTHDVATGLLRRKRFLGPLVRLIGQAVLRGGASIVRAARPLFRGSSLTKVNRRNTQSGRLTNKFYTRQGGMDQATRDFNRFRIRNPKPIQGGAGQTGRVGNHDITVRPRSTEGSPTLSIRSRRPGGDTVVRKFRYPEN